MVYTTDAQNLFQMRISAIIDEEEVEIWTNLRVVSGNSKKEKKKNEQIIVTKEDPVSGYGIFEN